MRRASKPFDGSDIAAGVIAAAAFVALVFLLHMPLWLGVFLAVCVYIGIWLFNRRPVREETESVTESVLLHQIDQLSHAVANPSVRSKIEVIQAEAGALRAFLAQHPDKEEAWRGIIRECLQSTLRIGQRYVELSRFFDDPSRQSLVQVEELLDQVAATFANLRARLVDEGAADLTAETEACRSTLQALNEVTVLNQREGSP